MYLIIPQIENYIGTIQQGYKGTFVGKVDNSPSLRFSSNILS